jgi:hypothetical protein
MEAFLLTLDVITLIALCIFVLRVVRTEDDTNMGWLGYSFHRVRKIKKTFADQGDPHA